MKTETEVVEESKVNEERAKKLIAEGGEINALDAIQIEIDSPQIASAIEELNKFVSEGSPSCDAILQEVRQTQLIQNITAEYKYYILMCGLFQGKRNCVKAWP